MMDCNPTATERTPQAECLTRSSYRMSRADTCCSCSSMRCAKRWPRSMSGILTTPKSELVGRRVLHPSSTRKGGVIDEYGTNWGARSERSAESARRQPFVYGDCAGVWRNDWPLTPSRPFRGSRHSGPHNWPDHAVKGRSEGPIVTPNARAISINEGLSPDAL